MRKRERKVLDTNQQYQYIYKSNIYMEWLETNKIKPILPDSDCVWLRYVDDVFAVIPKDINPNELLKELNKISDCIKITCEKESDKTLPFLDILLINLNNKFSFKVYRKPTHTESYVHAFSYHSNKTKNRVLIGLLLRALGICSPQFLDEEINHIKMF